ncbi:uncharacterized protein HMPREF1541_09639 [Cyphellophora europaea CBS 101466]|uniref:Uncharacterized protein n=1 Tax=Cyphellophora europaea (strain CBS 101466) TaxID=1220924 RepID=W2SAR0_CYPE1|nr:uncharacterized protein HMPREF1541_09639 [Cyphellophora europaea CBS 101466]ETN45806.1 hypothetical protein HMPREF1541_09639 [Cyphellophora europaea CBS 101466]
MASKPTGGGNGGMASDKQTPATAAIGATKPKVFDQQGAIGKQFTEQGAIGGAAQSIGGPLDKEGAIGKQFTADGALGGSVQKAMGGEKGGS